jgi:hypothetical protein
MASKQSRLDLIQRLERSFGGRIITYITLDRTGLAWNIAQDQVRWLYEQILSVVGSTRKVDRLILFLHSRGGEAIVPWSVVSMIREHCNEFDVLVPFRAHSAATAICMGADRIFMGPKGELSPIDIKLGDELAVEDVRGYIRLIKERASITDQHEVASLLKVVAEKLPKPLVLGNVERLLAQTRYAATGLLKGRKAGQKMDDVKIDRIANALTTEIAQHEHPISRREAEQLGLPVEFPKAEQEDLMWMLYLEYEAAMDLQKPYFPLVLMPQEQPDTYQINVPVAILESTQRTFQCVATYVVSVMRQMPGNLVVNVNFPLPPAALAPGGMTPEQQGAILRQLHQVAVQQVQAELRKLPVMQTKHDLYSMVWTEERRDAAEGQDRSGGTPAGSSAPG